MAPPAQNGFFFNLVALLACLTIDIALSARQRRYTTIGLLPLFGSTFIFTNVRVMTAGLFYFGRLLCGADST
jgi:uncharacterized membrane protein (GlpM family)